MSPEWSFVVACCRHVSRSRGREGLVVGAAVGLEWRLVEAIAARHRVEGIVHRALCDAGLPSPFSATAASIARQNLVHAAEARRLHDRLAAAAVAHLFLKGTTLEMLAWQSLSLKRSIDIDLLVDPPDYAQAVAILFEAGYRCTHPGDLPMPRIAAYARRMKDSVWRHRRRGITVELHQRLTANRALLPGLSARSPSQTVAIAPGIDLPTLARDELFAYLCVHGALTAWSRLKWAADLHAYLASEAELERRYRRAAEIAPRRAVAQALLVCEALFGLDLGPLAEELRRDPRNRRLAQIALATMVRGGPATELDAQRFGTARLHYSLLLLKPGLAYKAGELARQLRRLAAR
ncbi:MAG TPA: nucleotidyltransferase family protein [Allosphingosinicella sp.]|jgi:hypothetical protein